MERRWLEFGSLPPRAESPIELFTTVCPASRSRTRRLAPTLTLQVTLTAASTEKIGDDGGSDDASEVQPSRVTVSVDVPGDDAVVQNAKAADPATVSVVNQPRRTGAFTRVRLATFQRYVDAPGLASQSVVAFTWDCSRSSHLDPQQFSYLLTSHSEAARIPRGNFFQG